LIFFLCFFFSLKGCALEKEVFTDEEAAFAPVIFYCAEMPVDILPHLKEGDS